LNAIRRIICNFVSRIPQATIRFDSPPVDELQPAVVQELYALGIPLVTIQRWLRWACQVVECFYPKHSFDLKVLIVICNLVIFYIDDTLSINPGPLLSFQLNSLTGRPQEDPILECLAQKLLPRMWAYFDPLAANAIVVSFLEFINGTIMEGMAKSMMPLHPRASTFPEYVRLKSGAPAQYAFWLFPCDKHPDIKSYLQAIPDLLAFIK
jgi:Trichodiene synthase (TRI5)